MEQNKRAKEIKSADSELVQKFQNFLKEKHKSKVYTGTIGSGDVFNREIDRIDWISSNFGNICEDMESIGVYSVCNKLNIPCIGIRIISNNEITGEELDENSSNKLARVVGREFGILNIINSEIIEKTVYI